MCVPAESPAQTHTGVFSAAVALRSVSSSRVNKNHSICPMSPLLKMNSKIDVRETQVGERNMIKLNFHNILF